ncbi:transcription factor IIIB 50 kDa subunit-like [Ptychodera flava]|uniref:transcription factor IIIB 50 kDa subunit-like n=1 Tax=Ptychodera flava TaxID=63121 RepID=UPI003969C2DE
MSRKCPQCGEGTVERDEHYSHDQVVCTSCGTVIEEQSFQSETGTLGTFAFFDGTAPSSKVNRSMRQDLSGLIPRGKLTGINHVTDLSKKLRVPPEVKEGAISHFKYAYDAYFRHHTTRRKFILSGCCLYVACRQQDYPVTIKDMCQLLDCSKPEFNAVLKLLSSELDIQASSASLMEVVDPTLKKYGLADHSFIEKTKKLVELVESSWISCGRNAELAVLAAAYLIWKTTVGSTKRGGTYTQFCKKHDMEVNQTALKRVSELESLLVKLAEKLPWVNKDVLNSKTVTKYLDDILSHRFTLESSIKETHESKAENSDRESGSDASPFPFKTRSRKKRKRDNDDEVGESPIKFVSNSPELTEDDIPNSELHNYIKTPEEVALGAAVYNVIHSPKHKTVTREDSK